MKVISSELPKGTHLWPSSFQQGSKVFERKSQFCEGNGGRRFETVFGWQVLYKSGMIESSEKILVGL